MRIIIEENTVKEIGNQISNETETITTEIKKLANTVDAISSVWNGEDSNKFVSVAYDNVIANFNDLCEKLESYGKYLEKVPNVYEKLDSTFQSKRIDS